jgi:hypothetical protein
MQKSHAWVLHSCPMEAEQFGLMTLAVLEQKPTSRIAAIMVGLAITVATVKISELTAVIFSFVHSKIIPC